jgi:integrase
MSPAASSDTGRGRRQTKKEVQDELDRLRQRYAAGQQPAERMLLGAFFDFWLDGWVKVKVDAATYQMHQQRVKDYIVPHLGHVAVVSLTDFMVKQWYEDLEKAGCSADLRNKVGQMLRRCLRLAVKRRYATENVAAEIPLPRAEAEEMRPLDEAQLRQFLSAAAKYRHYPLYLLAVDSGMRQGEILALEWTDIDFTAGTVSITKTVKTGHKGPARVKDVKTKASRRRVRLTAQTQGALRVWRLRTPGRLVFPSHGKGATLGQGGYLHKASLRRSFLRVLNRARLAVIRFHDLRHTHATLALLKTKNIKAVSARLGHADVRVTLKTYAHYLPVMEKELVAAMEKLLAVSEERPAA